MVRLLTQSDAAKLLRLSERTLERLRLQGGGPPYIKCGRSVRYRETDLEAWIAQRIVSSTSDVGCANLHNCNGGVASANADANARPNGGGRGR